MCGRYQLSVSGKEITERYNVTVYDDFFSPKFNCAPGQLLPVITNEEPEILNFYRWGLIPFWAKDPSIGNKLINARAETIDSKPAFKNSFKNRRCLIPANGFYEWRKKDKTPFRIYLKGENLFSMAGIWDVWRDKENNEIRSFAIITTDSTGSLKEIHDRMPVILKPEDERKWLFEQDKDILKSMLKPVNEDLLEFYPVSKKINSPKNDDEQLIYPVSGNGDITLFD